MLKLFHSWSSEHKIAGNDKRDSLDDIFKRVNFCASPAAQVFFDFLFESRLVYDLLSCHTGVDPLLHAGNICRVLKCGPKCLQFLNRLAQSLFHFDRMIRATISNSARQLAAGGKSEKSAYSQKRE
jgi:hypothetical protein